MLQNAKVTASTVSKLLREINREGGESKLAPTQIKFKKEALAHLLSYEFYKIFKNTFFDRTPPVPGSIALC